MTVKKSFVIYITALVAIGLSTIAACADTGDSSKFIAKHGEVTDQYVIAHPLSEVFPLFDPINEIKWSPDFVITPVYPKPFAVIQGAIFQTVHHTRTATWLLNTYDKANNTIEYILINPDVTFTKMTIQCTALGADKTAVTVTYIVTGLSETGNEHVAKYDRAFLDEWRDAINGYFDGLKGQGGA